MKTQNFMRQPFVIQAIQVTAEDIEDIARWCHGEVIRDKNDNPLFIRIATDGVQRVRHSEAYPGMWITRQARAMRSSFKVFNDEFFQKEFQALPDTEEIGGGVSNRIKGNTVKPIPGTGFNAASRHIA